MMYNSFEKLTKLISCLVFFLLFPWIVKLHTFLPCYTQIHVFAFNKTVKISRIRPWLISAQSNIFTDFFFFWRIILLTSGHNSHFLKYLRFQPNWFLKLDTPKTRYRLQLVMLTTFQSMDHCTPISKSIQLNYIYVVIEINNEIRCKDRL